MGCMVLRTGRTALSQARQWRGLLLFLAVTGIASALAMPPEYLSFHRVQSVEPDDLAPESEWLEIWAIYIGQGDALLIRLPESLSYDLNGVSERIDILIDGGPGLALRTFLRRLYPTTTRIEHVVLTHHDGDHVNGITKLLEDDRFGIERIYHNGLASWARGAREFPPADQSPKAGQVFEKDRGLSLVEADGLTLKSDYFVDGLAALREAFDDGEFVGAYADFAHAIVTKSTPVPVTHFAQASRDAEFIEEAEADRIGNETHFDVLWPQSPQRRYRAWAYTINGNSVTFRFSYRNFSMLFPGDQNEDSEDDWMNNQQDELASDVLKIPHHGSQHNAEAFFDAVSPVLGVASMGSQGFRPRWKHPSEEVIRWMGGSHRVYSTFIHERRFRYEHLTSDSTRNALIESRHILIQTDGNWFRVVEVENPESIPSVGDVRRGDGTRWIRATE